MTKIYNLFDTRLVALWLLPVKKQIKSKWLSSVQLEQMIKQVSEALEPKLHEGFAATLRQMRNASAQDLRQFLQKQQAALMHTVPLVEETTGRQDAGTHLWIALMKEDLIFGRINANGKIILYPPDKCPTLEELRHQKIKF